MIFRICIFNKLLQAGALESLLAKRSVFRSPYGQNPARDGAMTLGMLLQHICTKGEVEVSTDGSGEMIPTLYAQVLQLHGVPGFIDLTRSDKDRVVQAANT